MEIVEFEPLCHYRQVAELWGRALGDTYPVTERVLRPRIWTRPSYEPGDAFVALVDGRVAGLGIVEIDRTMLPPGQMYHAL